jgi:hypothetical protein
VVAGFWNEQNIQLSTGAGTVYGADIIFSQSSTNIFQSLPIAYNQGTVLRATISVDIDSGDPSGLIYYLSADGGSHWEPVTEGEEYAFQFTGTDLRYKLVKNPSGETFPLSFPISFGDVDVVLTEIRIAYN